MKKFLLPVFVLIGAAFTSCNFCTKGSGPEKTETRELSDITKVQMDIDADVTIVRGKRSSVKITAEENLLSLIETNSSGEKLRIESSHCYSASSPVKIEVVVTDLRSVVLDGSGTIIIPDTIMTDNIKLELNGSGEIKARLVAASIKSELAGSGDIVLEGSANEQTLEITGSGNIKASQLPCNILDAEVTGSGDAYVYVIQDMKAEITGSGTIHYKGKPSLKTEVNGSGKVEDDN